MKTFEVNAKPYTYKFDLDHTALIIIDMQRDFCYEGGFGESLGNDITLTKSIIPTVEKILKAARNAGMFIVHTREGHRPDLTDCPAAKLRRSDGTYSCSRRIWSRYR